MHGLIGRLARTLARRVCGSSSPEARGNRFEWIGAAMIVASPLYEARATSDASQQYLSVYDQI